MTEPKPRYIQAIEQEVAKLKYICNVFGYDFEEAEKRFQVKCRTHQHLTVIEAIKAVRRDIVAEQNVGLN